MAIKQRVGIPGGTSEFDLPSYHHWLHHPASRRRADLEAWLKPLLPIHAALSIVLRVLRESGRTVSLIAFQGVYQQTPAERPAQMLRLALADARLAPASAIMRSIVHFGSNPKVLRILLLEVS